MKRGIFVTGTDTGVGKTVASAALILAFKEIGIDAGYMKPVATGCNLVNGRLVSPDVEFIREVCHLEDANRLINPVALEPPIDPLSASEAAGMVIEPHRLTEAFDELSKRHELLVVEGIGGIAVPLRHGFDVCGLIRAFGLPTIVVMRSSLGTINHSILTVDYARKREVDILGLIVNSTTSSCASRADRVGPEIVERILGLPCIARLPYDPDIARSPARAIRLVVPELIKWVEARFKDWR